MTIFTSEKKLPGITNKNQINPKHIKIYQKKIALSKKQTGPSSGKKIMIISHIERKKEKKIYIYIYNQETQTVLIEFFLNRVNSR